MYEPIKMTDTRVPSVFKDTISLDPLMESTDIGKEVSLFTEAVFANGKNSLKPILDDVTKIKEELETKINECEKDNKKVFNPKSYWRSLSFKKLEDDVKSVFGFRYVAISPFNEKYDPKTKEFESKVMNCMVYHMDRFPVDGLVSDKGFYDKTHSLVMEIYISLGLVHALTPEELTAVFLHEFGHNIDPALVDIKYAQSNILSKYLTDRKKDLNKSEKKTADKTSSENNKLVIVPIIMDNLGWNIQTFISNIKKSFKKTELVVKSFAVGKIFNGKDKREKKAIEKIRKAVKSDSERKSFNRQNYGEAFADNFARMYGYGPQLMSGLHKMSKNTEAMVNSWYKKERMRQLAIYSITQDMIKDEHKTDIHRIKNLINEYHNDINDPNIPKQVKKSLEEDVKELEKLLDMYTNSFSDFQNKVNKAIAEELDNIEGIKEDASDDTKSDNKKDDKNINESSYFKKLPLIYLENFLRANVNGQFREFGQLIPAEYIKEDGFTFHIDNDDVMTESADSEYISESKKAHEKLQKNIDAVTPAERALFYKIFGHSKACSLAKDKDGYYVTTHRARSKSYKRIEDIPEKDVKFVRSTS